MPRRALTSEFSASLSGTVVGGLEATALIESLSLGVPLLAAADYFALISTIWSGSQRRTRLVVASVQLALTAVECIVTVLRSYSHSSACVPLRGPSPEEVSNLRGAPSNRRPTLAHEKLVEVCSELNQPRRCHYDYGTKEATHWGQCPDSASASRSGTCHPPRPPDKGCRRCRGRLQASGRGTYPQEAEREG